MRTVAASNATAASHAGTGRPQEFLTLRLGAEEYGIDILRVQEIRSYDHLMAIGAVEDRLLILVDIEKLMSSAEMGLVSTDLH